MRLRPLGTGVLALVLLLTILAPVAGAQTPAPTDDGALTPVQDTISDEALDTLLEGVVRTGADIVNGTPTGKREYPYVSLVLIFNPKTGLITGDCTGSVIRSTWILTAGHCLAGAKGIAVVPALTDVRTMTVDDLQFAKAFATAPGFRLAPPRRDVGLVKLGSRAGVAPVRVAGASDDDWFLGGTPATIVGWGDRTGKGEVTNVLREGDVTLLSTDACYAQLGARLFDHAGMVCGGGLVNDACVGDSGGPLLVRGDAQTLLLGVTSFGDLDCGVGDASAYARVSDVRRWIERLSGLPARAGTPRVYRDLTRDERHFEAILKITYADIATGFPNGDYRADRSVTRAEMATFLARAFDLTASSEAPFSDVDPASPHAVGITAVAEAGIATGPGDGTFRPDDPVTRAQMASFLARALDLDATGTPLFRDVADDATHAGAIAAVAKAGITTGAGGRRYLPGQAVTRGQMASFIARALGLLTLEPSA